MFGLASSAPTFKLATVSEPRRSVCPLAGTHIYIHPIDVSSRRLALISHYSWQDIMSLEVSKILHVRITVNQVCSSMLKCVQVWRWIESEGGKGLACVRAVPHVSFRFHILVREKWRG